MDGHPSIRPMRLTRVCDGTMESVKYGIRGCLIGKTYEAAVDGRGQLSLTSAWLERHRIACDPSFVPRQSQSGYARQAQPDCTVARLLVMIEEAYLASGGVHVARNVHRDLTEARRAARPQACRTAMRERGLRSVSTPRKRRYGGKPAAVLRRTACNASSRSSSRTRRGSPTSPNCARPKAGSTSPPRSTCRSAWPETPGQAAIR